MTGRPGRRNCLVIGITRPVMRRVAKSVLTIGPGDSMTLKANMPIIDRKI
jgi:hypothetical protein